jgi:ATP:corrinoid adenosyltransferase
MSDMTPEDTAALNERHRQRMERKKAVIDAKIAAADKKIGIIIVNTGNGKGKSSSAFGMAVRALGHGMKVGVVQFIKGAMSTGEESSCAASRTKSASMRWAKAIPGKPRTANATSPRPRRHGNRRGASWPIPPTAWWCWMN